MPDPARTKSRKLNEDAALVRRWAEDQDPGALSSLLDRHWETAFRLAYARLADPAAAEDAAQLAFIDLTRKAERFDGRREFGPWFRSLVLNRARNARRSRGRRRFHENKARLGEATHAEAASREESRGLAEAIDRLPEELRAAVVLHYFQGMSHKAISEDLGWTRGVVASRLRQGLGRLRESLAAAGFQALLAPDALELAMKARRAKVPALPAARTIAALAVRRLSAIKLAVFALGGLVVAGFGALLLGEPDAPRVAAAPMKRAAPLVTAPGDATERAELAEAEPVRAEPESREESEAGRAASAAPSAKPAKPAAEARREAVLEVAVVDDTGRPLAAGVEVSAVLIHDEETWVEVKGLTDEGGLARLEVEPGACYDLYMRRPDSSVFGELRAFERGPTAPGYPDRFLPQSWGLTGPSSPRATASEGETRRYELGVPRMVEVSGRVSPGGFEDPKGVGVLIDWDGPGSLAVATSCDVDPSDLSFRALVNPGKNTFTAIAPRKPRAGVVIDARPGQQLYLELAIGEGRRRLTGQVIDRQGRAIEGVAIRSPQAEVFTDREGRFELKLDGKACELRFFGEGVISRRLAIPAGEEDLYRDVAIAWGGKIEVAFTDRRWSRGLEVYIKAPADRPGLEQVSGTVRRRVPRGWSLASGDFGEGQVKGDIWWISGGRSGATMTLEKLPPGRYQVKVGRSLEGGDWREVTVAPGETSRLRFDLDALFR